MTNEPHPITRAEFDAIMREGATDEEIGAVLRSTFHWSFIIRDPLGTVCACGRDRRRAECISVAFVLADDHASDTLTVDCLGLGKDDPEREQRALNEPWRLVLWPPKFDPDPRAWVVFDDDDEEDWEDDEGDEEVMA